MKCTCEKEKKMHTGKLYFSLDIEFLLYSELMKR